MFLGLILVGVSTWTGGCARPDGRPSEGACLGSALGAEAVSIDPDLSGFYLVMDGLFDEDGAIEWSYGEGRLTASSRWETLPLAVDVGTHLLPVGSEANDLIEVFTATITGPNAPDDLASGVLELTTSGRDRIEGSFILTYENDQTVECFFDLRRAYELDASP